MAGSAAHPLPEPQRYECDYETRGNEARTSSTADRARGLLRLSVDRFLEILPCAMATLARSATPGEQSVTDHRGVALA